MFIYSLRANTVKMIGVLCVALTVLITLIAFVPTFGTDGGVVATGKTSYSYEKIRNASDVSAFLSQFGWVTESEPCEVRDVTVPGEFDKIFAAYNEIQKAQGLNLSRYRGKAVTRYTFVLKNYPNTEEKVFANVLVWRNRVIGGDICSADASGFVHGFELPDGQSARENA